MIARSRKRCSRVLLSVFGLALAASALPALADTESCCDEMQAEAGARCEWLSAAGCCDCPGAVYTAIRNPVPPTPAASTAILAPRLRVTPVRASMQARPPDLRIALVRSVVLRL